MTNAGQENHSAKAANGGDVSAKKRRLTPLRILLLCIGALFVVWEVLNTEHRVRDLQSRGFSDVVIESMRNHAYFPIIGAFIGAVVFSLAFIVIKRVIHEIRN
ncbi:MAG: hypothetical protein DCF29_13665 [Alphaproteobacteria bacterium]|nr:MAG: hypothetical protein DCF29_13665 [Alphaproteobacteria bacterium]